ncbi:MAG: hypothetical protein KAI24_21005, partial [Planctomycetes bacterium]|nr:hypothetical protein [Planctomycetota bacterium]
VLRASMQHSDEPQLREQLFDLLLTQSHRAEAAHLLEDRTRWRPSALHDARRRLALAEGDFAGAAAALRDAVALDPGNADAQITLLRDVLADDGREAALQAARRIVEQHADDPHLLVRVQEFYDELEHRQEGEALLRRLVEEHPTQWWLRGRLTRWLIRTGRAVQATPHAATMLRQLPDTLAVWIDAIDAAADTDDRERALDLLSQAAARWADEPMLLSRRRRYAANAAQAADAAREALAAALQRHVPPADEDLAYLVDAAEADLGAEAVEPFLRDLQQRFPGEPAIAVARCRWLSDRDPPAAVRLATELHEQFPWQLTNGILLGRCLRAAGRRQEERELLERLIEREPGHARAWTELGESLEQEGRTQEAMSCYDRGIAKAPHDPTLLGMRASLRWTVGDRAGALADADRAAMLASGYGWVRRAQVMWRAQVGDLDGALHHAESCLRDNPTWRLAYELLATAHEARGDQERRLEALRGAMRIDPRVGGARADLLDALLEMRQFDEAERVVQEGLDLLGERA